MCDIRYTKLQTRETERRWVAARGGGAREGEGGRVRVGAGAPRGEQICSDLDSVRISQKHGQFKTYPMTDFLLINCRTSTSVYKATNKSLPASHGVCMTAP